MQLLDDLRREHDLIDQVLGSLRTFVSACLAGQGDPVDGARFLTFFRHYAGTFHHDKEETLLFQALIEKAELPGGRGPIAALTAEHHHMAGLLEAMAGLLEGPLTAETDRARLRDLAVDYSWSLWRHIDAENSVMFPESEERLRRAFVHELPSRPMTAQEQAAREDGLALLAAYPPQPDLQVPRGDGCINCPSFGTTCEGLETEWWTESEWEERWDRMGGD